MTPETSRTDKSCPNLTISHWSETPYRLASANVRADVSELPGTA